MILLGALAFSKRATEDMGADATVDRAARPPWRRHRATDLVSATKNPCVEVPGPPQACS